MRLNGLDPSNLEARDAVTKEYEFLQFGQWDTKAKKYAANLLAQRYVNEDGTTTVAKPLVRSFWWPRLGKTPLFAKAANRLLKVHVTTAAAERNWSSWGRTCTSLRNRLKIETASMLISVKGNNAISSTEHHEVVLDTLYKYPARRQYS